MYTMLITSGTLLICFIIFYDVNKDLNSLLSFPDEAIPLKLKSDLRIILDLKPEKLRISRLGKNLGVLIKKVWIRAQKIRFLTAPECLPNQGF